MSRRSRVPLFLGLAAAGGIGYYLYRAGGNPKVAENKFEADVHKASANVKARLPARPGDAAPPAAPERDFKSYGAEAGAKLDETWADADRQMAKIKAETEAYIKDAKAEAMRAVDKFDREVEEGANKARSSLSGWFASGNSPAATNPPAPKADNAAPQAAPPARRQ